MANTWRLFITSAPARGGYEVNRGFLSNGVFSYTNPGGAIEVSKLFLSDNTIAYVQRSVISSNIVNGVYTPPSTGNALDFSSSNNSGYIGLISGI
jgi:hypothetical protein